jgi:hypothetical protein
VSYGKLVHVTYVEHQFYWFCEKEHVLHPNVHKLVTNGDEVLVKSLAGLELQIHYST